jgi:uncharacterized Rmd1/YagE family protein
LKTRLFRAHHLTERLKLTSLLPLFPEKPFRTSSNELAYRFGRNQYLIIYRFGSLVFFDVDPSRENEILSSVQHAASPKEEALNSEEFALEEGKPAAVQFRKVVVDEVDFDRIQIVALVLAQSVALDHYEALVKSVLDKSVTFSEQLEKEGRIGRKMTSLLKFIGFCLNTKQKVLSSTYLLDSPDPTWEDASLENLYRQMTDMFEIRERFRTLEYKLKTVQETVEILSDLAQSRRALYLEIAIVILIAVELVIMLRP